MLKQKMTGNSGHLPPELPGVGPEMTVIDVQEAANQNHIRARSHARRMRRNARAVRGAHLGRRGWAVGLW